LALIFWEHQNFLFHSYFLLLNCIVFLKNPEASKSQLKSKADALILSVLCISDDDDDEETDSIKLLQFQLVQQLNISQKGCFPLKEEILKCIASHNFLEQAAPLVQEFFTALFNNS